MRFSAKTSQTSPLKQQQLLDSQLICCIALTNSDLNGRCQTCVCFLNCSIVLCAIRYECNIAQLHLQWKMRLVCAQQ